MATGGATPALTHVEEAIRAMRVVMNKHYPKLAIMATCAPGGSSAYNRFIMFTHKIINTETNAFICYITYRSKRPLKDEEPLFSSYEILDASYSSLGKYHVDHSDGTNGASTFKEVFKAISALIK